jgi:opacity protein-like surface antigen
VLAGRRLDSGALAYGRAGVRASTFDTRYASENSSSADTSSRFGFEYGVGTRVPVSDHFSVGMEYVHAVFDDYLMAPGNGEPDAFGNSESTARISAAWHFNPIPRGADAPVAYSFAGTYWGLQVGHGGLSSFTTGERQEETIPPDLPVTSVLNADFGDTGFTAGLLVGHNLQMGSFVLGGEIDAEFAQQEWNHERDPSGRDFSIEKVASGSASVRAGVVLNDAALAYARVGVTGSYFNIDFATTSSTASSEDWRAGLRYGGGLEVPIDESIALRFDYTFTDYGTLKLQTPPGLETYDTQESLFRLGAILKL